MKPRANSPLRSSSLPFSVRSAAFAALVLAVSSTLHAQSWDGGGTTVSWGTPDNWNPNGSPPFNTTTDLVFNNLTRPDNNIGAARIVRSISYGADMDGNFLSNLRTFDGGAAATLTMQAASGNASITVDGGATGNITLGWNGVGTVGGAFTLGSNLDVTHNGTGEFLINRQIVGTGFGFTKSGTGTMRVAASNANTFTGAVSVNGGRLIMGSTNASSADLNTSSGITLGGGILEIRTTSALAKSITSNLTVSSASTLAYNNTTGTTQTFTVSTGTMALDANLTVQNLSSDTALVNGINISRNITGSGSMIVEGNNNISSSANSYGIGRILLSGNNSSWSGNLTVAKGTVSLSGNAVNSAGTGAITIGTTGDAFGAGLTFFPTGPNGTTVTYANNITARSGGFRSIKGSGTDHSIVLNGTIALDGDLNVDHTLSGSASFPRSLTLGGAISGVGGLNFTRVGTSTFTNANLTGNNTYSGATSIGAGATLAVNSTSGNGIGNSSAVTLAAAGAILNLGNTETIGSLASASTDGTVNLGSFTLTTGGTNATTSYGGVVAGTGGLSKAGNGTMTLTGTNTYTGATQVSAGVLAVNGSLANTSTTVSGTGTLRGSGSIGGTVNINSGGTLASGNSIDSLATGTLSLASGSTFAYEINNDAAATVAGDLTAVTGDLNIASGAILTLAELGSIGGSWTLGEKLTLASYTGAWNNGLLTYNASTLADDSTFSFSGIAWMLNYNDTVSGTNFVSELTGSSFVTMTAIPESSSVLLGGLGLLALLRRRRDH